jgi:enoyl-CoA hydratase/carnithine racemase
MAEEPLVICDINENENRADLIINRPAKKNALSIALLKELTDAITAIQDNDNIHCIVLSCGIRRLPLSAGVKLGGKR